MHINETIKETLVTDIVSLTNDRIELNSVTGTTLLPLHYPTIGFFITFL